MQHDFGIMKISFGKLYMHISMILTNKNTFGKGLDIPLLQNYFPIIQYTLNAHHTKKNSTTLTKCHNVLLLQLQELNLPLNPTLRDVENQI